MLLVGRGGQGVVVASQILADTFARAGYWVQSFPEFKAERRGAPISAFIRWDGAGPIHRRYKVRECDVLVGVSAAPPAAAFAAVRPGGLVLLNRERRYRHTGRFEFARVPASQIARDHGVLSAEGRPLGNVAMLGACVRLLLPDGLPLLEAAISARLGKKLGEANILAAREGFARCTRQHRVQGDVQVEAVVAAAPARLHAVFPVTTTDSLANHTGSWSEERPILLPPCNSCALCVLFCPEGAITRADGTMAIDYDYCKGCGICEDVCPVKGAIAMEEVA